MSTEAKRQRGGYHNTCKEPQRDLVHFVQHGRRPALLPVLVQDVRDENTGSPLHANPKPNLLCVVEEQPLPNAEQVWWRAFCTCAHLGRKRHSQAFISLYASTSSSSALIGNEAIMLASIAG